MINKIQKQAYKILFFQLAVVSLLAIIVLLFKQSLSSSLSIFFGGLAYLLPSLILIAKIFSPAKGEGLPKAFQIIARRKRRRVPECTHCYMRSESSLQQRYNLKGEGLLKAFYVGETIKLALSFILLLLLFHFIPVKIIFILMGYGAASLSLLLLPATSYINGKISW